MQCPYCGTELRCEDYYGRGIPGRSDFKKLGDIYKCQNEFCESEIFNRYFYTDQNKNLHEGYPC